MLSLQKLGIWQSSKITFKNLEDKVKCFLNYHLVDASFKRYLFIMNSIIKNTFKTLFGLYSNTNWLSIKLFLINRLQDKFALTTITLDSASSPSEMYLCIASETWTRHNHANNWFGNILQIPVEVPWHVIKFWSEAI